MTTPPQGPNRGPSSTSSTTLFTAASDITSSMDDTSSTSTISTPPLPVASTTSPPSSSPSPTAAVATTKPNAGAIAGGVIGGVVFLLCALLAILLYLRARKRKRTAPSSEFMNSLQPGAAPVLRLDSGAEYVSEKGGFTPYPHSVSPHLPQSSSYLQSMKFPESMMLMDIPSSRPSIEKPLQPQRFSAQHATDLSGGHSPPLSTSVGSRKEMWGGDIEVYPRDLSPVPNRNYPSRGSDRPVTAPRYSSNEPSSYSSFWQPGTPQEHSPQEASWTPSSLQPLRRRQDSDAEGM
ncbi:hypothetical protein BU15DRAFT_74514 [Melanogaster broomeanus]|nr:hypothetical protein BU15DRAFT_74514 [Melanogaster broomeanus]